MRNSWTNEKIREDRNVRLERDVYWTVESLKTRAKEHFTSVEGKSVEIREKR